jgi:LPXTG-motif cell wall-anchored protein
MRKIRLLGVVAALALVAAPLGLSPASAEEAEEGMGTANASLTVLGAEVGDLLSLRLLGDDVVSTTDPAVSAPRAVSAISPLTVESALDVLNALTVPPVEVVSTGGESSESTDAVNLASPLTAGQLLPAGLSAVVDDLGARGGITAGLVDLGVVGGVLTLESVDVSASTDAASGASEAVRNVSVDALTVLDLSALLKFLGIDLADLPLGVVSDLLGELGIDLDGVVGTLEDTVEALQAALSDLVGVTGEITPELCGVLDDTVNTILDPITGGDTGGVDDLLGLGDGLLGAAQVGDTCEALVGESVETLQNLLEDNLLDLLLDALAILEGAPLLAVDGVTAQMLAKATDSVDTSAAEITAAIGDIRIGELTLAGLDVGAVLGDVNALVNEVVGLVDDVLGTISPALSGIVEVDVLEQVTSVTETDGYVNASAVLTALRATVTPPDLDALLGGLGIASAHDTLGGLITELGGTVPELDLAVTQLADLLGVDILGALGQVTLEVASLSATANHTTVAAQAPGAPGEPTPVTELPRTGTSMAAAMILGFILLAGALGTRRWLRIHSSPSV